MLLLKHWINHGFTKIISVYSSIRCGKSQDLCTVQTTPACHASAEAQESQSYLETLVIIMGTCQMLGGWEDSLIKCSLQQFQLGNGGHSNWVPFRQQSAPSVTTQWGSLLLPTTNRRPVIMQCQTAAGCASLDFIFSWRVLQPKNKMPPYLNGGCI